MTLEVIQERIDEFKELFSSAISQGEQNRAYRLLLSGFFMIGRKRRDARSVV